VEEVLAGIWQELLGVERVGRHDNFFDLGGHSLLVISLIDKLRGWGINLNISQIFKFPTIAALSASFVSERSRYCDSDCVVMMKQGSSDEIPLFLIHDGGGDIVSYMGLAELLSGGAPIYGVRALGVDSGSDIFSSIENMASYYIESIRKVGDWKAFRLAGWSMGGVVAYEMSRQLSMGGERVDFVVMIDSFALGSIDGIERDVSMKSVAVRFLSFVSKGLSEGFVEQMNEMENADDIVQECYRLGLMPADMSMDETKDIIRKLYNMTVAIHRFHPTGFEGNSYLLLAEQKSVADSMAGFDEVRARGWGGLGDGTPKAVQVGGDHYTIMQPPYLRMVADKINELMQ